MRKTMIGLVFLLGMLSGGLLAGGVFISQSQASAGDSTLPYNIFSLRSYLQYYDLTIQPQYQNKYGFHSGVRLSESKLRIWMYRK
jgi:hypothetical protein